MPVVPLLYVVRVPKDVRTATPDDLLTSAEVALERGIDVATVNRWAKSGRLVRAVKVTGLRGPNLYRRSDVDAFLASERKSA